MTRKIDTEEAPSGSASVAAVGVAFSVLEELANNEGPVGTSELARRLQQTKARVHRHLITLRELGFVEKDSTSDRYRLGWKAYRFGIKVTESFDLRQLAEPHLAWLHEVSGQTVALAIPAGPAQVTVIEALTRTDQVAITISPGSVIPALTSALGRAILAFQPVAVRTAALAVPLPASTDEPPRDVRELAQQLDQVRERWYEHALNERLPGVAALAAPVFDDRNQAVASVCVIGSVRVLGSPPPPLLQQQVRETAVRISSALRSTAWQAAAPLPDA